MGTAPFERDDNGVPQDKPRLWPVVWHLIWQEMIKRPRHPEDSTLFRVFVTVLMWIFMILPLGLMTFATIAILALLGKVLRFW